MNAFAIPPGIYVAKPVRIEYGESRGRATPYLRIIFAIVHPTQFEGEPISHDLWLTPAGLPITQKVIGTCGGRVAGRGMREILEELEQLGEIEGFGSTNVKLVVVEEYSDFRHENIVRVRYVNPVTENRPAPVTGRARALAALQAFDEAQKAKTNDPGTGGTPPSSAA